mmetsp:Transcript_31363/g.56180  ORF Transcript_31363/g.56180 Transcript_31363/m.56180 type:complete len:86 (-) Transcript_31363:4370-4627(-)
MAPKRRRGGGGGRGAARSTSKEDAALVDAVKMLLSSRDEGLSIHDIDREIQERCEPALRYTARHTLEKHKKRETGKMRVKGTSHC